MRLPRAALACLYLLACAPAGATGTWSATLAGTTDYVLRGISQSYGKPAWQGGLAYHDTTGWYAGAWTSSIEPFPYGKRFEELDLFVGYGWLISPQWNARASCTHYQYVQDKRPRSYDYDEFAFTLGYEDRLSATISWQPDSTGYSTQGYVHGRQSLGYELSGRWPLAGGLSLTASAGYYDVSKLYGEGYGAGSLGASYSRSHLQVTLSRLFVDPAAYRIFDDASADGEWVASVVLRF